MAPYFKTEPVRTQVHLEGNRLVLTCMAEGSWPLEFKWLHNSRELTKFSLEYRQAPAPTSLPFLPLPGACHAPKGCQVGGLGSLGAGTPDPVQLGGWAVRIGGQRWPCPGVRKPCPSEPTEGGWEVGRGAARMGGPCSSGWAEAVMGWWG